MFVRKWVKLTILVLCVALGYYAYRAGELYFNQEKYLYHPDKVWTATPASEGLAFEEVTLESSDGQKLSAWYLPSADPKGTILFLHGNKQNISLDLDALKMFQGLGFNVFTLDYRGYGKSEGSPSEEGMYQDAQAAWDWLVRVKQESQERIVISGRSLGAAVAADLASKNKSRALILEAAFTSLPEAAQDLYPYFPAKVFSKYHYDTFSKLPRIHCPVLIVHSRQDELIPFRHAERLYAALPGKRDFIELGGPHKGGYKPTLGQYHDGVKRFLDSL